MHIILLTLALFALTAMLYFAYQNAHRERDRADRAQLALATAQAQLRATANSSEATSALAQGAEFALLETENIMTGSTRAVLPR